MTALPMSGSATSQPARTEDAQPGTPVSVRVLIWLVLGTIAVVLALVLLALVKGLASLVTGTLPVLVLLMAAWLAVVTLRLVRLEERVAERR